MIMNKKELSKKFPYIPSGKLNYEIEMSTYKTGRGLLNHLSTVNNELEIKATRPNVKHLEIELEWRNSSYGCCPTASYRVEFENGVWDYVENFTRAGGCGYDKTSTCIANVMNEVCSGMLWRKRRTRKEIPYGISGLKKHEWFPYFEGGVGESCYYRIARFLGGKMEHVAEAKMYDKFVFTFK